MILLIRDNECFEPRLRNYIDYFNSHNIPYHVIAWNRNGSAQPDMHITFYQRHAEYGKRAANIPKKIGWMFFAAKQIVHFRHEYKMIHACDIDGILPALFVGKILNKKVIFDIFDWISSLTGKGAVYKLVEFLQNFCYRHSDAVILCEEERKSQAKAKNDTVFVIPNIPNKEAVFDPGALEQAEKDLIQYDYVISYVGVFDKDRGLENLVEAVSQFPNIKLNIAGFGVLEDMIKLYSDRFSNITYWGRVEYAVGQAIQKNSHMIAAMYHLTSPLHKYAAPNKYYESLALGVPMITTENTLVGSKVEKYDTGFVLDERPDSLLAFLKRSDLRKQIEQKKVNCTTTWRKYYAGYFDKYMTDVYIKTAKEWS